MGGHRGRLLGELRRNEIAVLDIAYDGESVLDEHRHDGAYLSVVVDGSYTELRDGLPRHCVPGTAIFHGPGEVHADYFAAEGRCVNFEAGSRATFCTESLLRAVTATHPHYEPAVRAALAATGAATVRHDQPAWLRAVLHEFNWLEPVPLEGASVMAGLHPTHFVRAFRRHAGMTPGEYRRAARVRAASSLLLESSSPISRIAHECGFSDQSHLTNVFREATGISPRRYRRAFAR
jgi:AraC family transcriptional regulator